MRLNKTAKGRAASSVVAQRWASPLAKQRGAQITPGIEMFAHQAARQFEIWTGKPAPWDEMIRVVLLALQERTARAAVK